MMEPGFIDPAMVADESLFPVELDAAEMVKYRWLYRAWQLNIDYHIPLGGPGSPEETGTLEIIAVSAATDESELRDPRPPAFTGVSSTTTGTITTDDGINPPVVNAWAPTWVLNVCNRDSDFIPPASPDLNDYYVNATDPEAVIYLPRVEFRLGSSIGALGSMTNYTPADDGNVNTAIQTFSGTWDGEPIDIQCVTSTTRPFDTYSFTAIPVLAWPYTGASGDIWDEVTFAELQDHSTTED
jgi:hypothetical protein